MDALQASGFPVGLVVVGATLVVLLLLAMMAFISQRAPALATPTVVISLFMLITFVVVTVFSTLKALPESKIGELLLGALISTFTTVVVFWFGKKDSDRDGKN
jgi:FtsH-binding integral membrane protein